MDKTSTSLIILGSTLILYGLNIRRKTNCIICNKKPLCIIYSNCKPKSYEGFIIQNFLYLIKKLCANAIKIEDFYKHCH